MANFFGRPLNALIRDVAIASGQAAAEGAVVGYFRARSDDDTHPFLRAARTAGTWAATEAVTETALQAFFPGIRDGGPIQSALVSSAMGAVTGAVDGFSEAKIHGEDDPFHHAMIGAGQWAAIEGATDILTRVGIPALTKRFQ